MFGVGLEGPTTDLLIKETRPTEIHNMTTRGDLVSLVSLVSENILPPQHTDQQVRGKKHGGMFQYYTSRTSPGGLMGVP